MNIKKHIAISESGVLFNGSTGDSYSVNPIATEILDMLKNKLSEEQIKVKIQAKYEVTPERLEGDIYDFLAHLRQLNLIEIDE
jgi:hypothetical protein